MFLAEMHFYYWWEKDSKICVQNIVAGMKGQYHEHTPEEFENWKAGIEEKYLHKLE